MTGVPPAQLLMERNLKSRFDLLKPNLTARVEQKQQRQKHCHDTHAVLWKFQEGEEVYAHDFRPGHTWLPCKIVKCSGSVSNKVQLDNDQIVRRQSAPVLIMTEDTSTGTPIVEAATQQPRRNPHCTRRRPDRYTS